MKRATRAELARQTVHMLAGLTGLFLYAFAALSGSRKSPGLWAGATVLLAWALLTLAALRAAFRRGPCRARWAGAALFGMGYLWLVSGHSDTLTWPQYATNRLLNTLRPRLAWVPTERPARTDAIATANFRALKALDGVVPMDFPSGTPLEDVVTHIVAATRAPDGREVPIFVDPVSLQEVEKTMHSPVILKLDGVPLRTTLELALGQLGMRYVLEGGLITITSDGCFDGYHEPAYTDAFLLTGQSLLALLAAGLGGILAPLAVKPGDDAGDPS